jgi:hypothetical protein
MDHIWETVLVIVGSVGGAGLIIAFVGKWLAQLIADRIIQSKQQQFEKDQAEMRAKFELELEQYRTKATEYTYVSQLQFETEFRVYQSLFQNLYQFGVCTSDLYPSLEFVSSDPNKAKADYEERYKKYFQSYKTFSSALEQNAPFVPKHIYDSFFALRQQARLISTMYYDLRINPDTKDEAENAKIIKENYENARAFRDNIANIKNSVRDYLGTLRIQN